MSESMGQPEASICRSKPANRAMFRLSVHPMDKRVLSLSWAECLGFPSTGICTARRWIQTRCLWRDELNIFNPFFPDNRREAQLLFEGLKPVAYGGLAEKQDIRCFCDAFCIHNGEEGFDFREKVPSAAPLNIDLVNIIY